MAETMRVGCDGTEKWHWWQIQTDLVEQGGLNEHDTFIDPLSMKENASYGAYKNKKFVFSWAKDKFFMLSTLEYSQILVDAFSKVLEYKPFCRYSRDGIITVEWDKVDPQSRLNTLNNDETIYDVSAADIKERKG
jgi:hypothetical protein